MNKKLIRLTESDLHRIVEESVYKILKESAYDMNSLEYKQMYDRDRGYDMFDFWNAEDDRRVADYEALPDKARHPYGSEIPDLSDRIKNRPWKVKASDKLASKKPKSILRKMEGWDTLDIPDSLPDNFFYDDDVHELRWKNTKL